MPQKIELIRSTEEEKQSQLKRLRDFKARHKDESDPMLARLQQAVIDNQNVFEVPVGAVRCYSLGQITNALFEVRGSTGGVCRLGRFVRSGLQERAAPHFPVRIAVARQKESAGALRFSG